jgi:hypothetical protein
MRCAVQFVTFLFLFVPAVLPATRVTQTRPDFSGNWTFESATNGRSGLGRELAISQSGQSLTIEFTTVGSTPEQMKLVYRLDGAPSKNGRANGHESMSAASWSGETLTIQTGPEKRVFELKAGKLVIQTSTTAFGPAPTTVVYARQSARTSRPNFAGKWATEFVRTSGGSGLGLELSITQDDHTLSIEYASGNEPRVQQKVTYRLDGSETKNRIVNPAGAEEIVSTATWTGSTLVIRIRSSDGEQKRTFELKDGNLVVSTSDGDTAPRTLIYKKAAIKAAESQSLGRPVTVGVVRWGASKAAES